MKKALLTVLLVASSLAAQQPRKPNTGQLQQTPSPAEQRVAASANVAQQDPATAGRPAAPLYSKINCSGFVTAEKVPMETLVIGGQDSPQETQYGTNETVFLTGAGLTVGGQYRVVRRVKDPNNTESSKDATRLVKKVGDQWADLGIVRVQDLVNGTAVATVALSCQPMLPGDVAIPFVERPEVTLDKTRTRIKGYGVAEGPLKGQIIQAFEFDNEIGIGERVYVSLGADKVKPGDYLRIVRSYSTKRQPPIDKVSLDATVLDDTSDRMPKVDDPVVGKKHHTLDKMPPHGIGEMIILWATPQSAVGLVTIATEDIKIGDDVTVEQQ